MQPSTFYLFSGSFDSWPTQQAKCNLPLPDGDDRGDAALHSPLPSDVPSHVWAEEEGFGREERSVIMYVNMEKYAVGLLILLHTIGSWVIPYHIRHFEPHSEIPS